MRTLSATTARDSHADSENDLNELRRLVIVRALMLHLVIPMARLNLAIQARRVVIKTSSPAHAPPSRVANRPHCPC